jgi:hypothetical protein
MCVVWSRLCVASARHQSRVHTQDAGLSIIIPTGKETQTWTFSLWEESATKGWISTRLEGNVVVYKNVPRQAVLANVSVAIDVR